MYAQFCGVAAAVAPYRLNTMCVTIRAKTGRQTTNEQTNEPKKTATTPPQRVNLAQYCIEAQHIGIHKTYQNNIMRMNFDLFALAAFFSVDRCVFFRWVAKPFYKNESFYTHRIVKRRWLPWACVHVELQFCVVFFFGFNLNWAVKQTTVISCWRPTKRKKCPFVIETHRERYMWRLHGYRMRYILIFSTPVHVCFFSYLVAFRLLLCVAAVHKCRCCCRHHHHRSRDKKKKRHTLNGFCRFQHKMYCSLCVAAAAFLFRLSTLRCMQWFLIWRNQWKLLTWMSIFILFYLETRMLLF